MQLTVAKYYYLTKPKFKSLNMSIGVYGGKVTFIVNDSFSALLQEHFCCSCMILVSPLPFSPPPPPPPLLGCIDSLSHVFKCGALLS